MCDAVLLTVDYSRPHRNGPALSDRLIWLLHTRMKVAARSVHGVSWRGLFQRLDTDSRAVIDLRTLKRFVRAELKVAAEVCAAGVCRSAPPLRAIG